MLFQPLTYQGLTKSLGVARMEAVRETYSSHTSYISIEPCMGATHKGLTPLYANIALCMGAVCEGSPPTYVGTVYGSCM